MAKTIVERDGRLEIDRIGLEDAQKVDLLVERLGLSKTEVGRMALRLLVAVSESVPSNRSHRET